MQYVKVSGLEVKAVLHCQCKICNQPKSHNLAHYLAERKLHPVYQTLSRKWHILILFFTDATCVFDMISHNLFIFIILPIR